MTSLINNRTVPLRGRPISDSNGTFCNRNPFDQDISTTYRSTSSICYVGLDFGASSWAYLESISYVLSVTSTQSSMKIFQGGAFEGSNDSSVWEQISTIGN